MVLAHSDRQLTRKDLGGKKGHDMSAKLEYCPPEDVLFNSHVDVLESDAVCSYIRE